MCDRRRREFSAKVVLLSVSCINAVFALLQLTVKCILHCGVQVAAGAGGVVVNNNSASSGNNGLGGRRGKSKLDKLQLDLEVPLELALQYYY
jgi:hypothetical protein